MKSVQDSLFSISVPSRFFAIRRSAKGDLPDEKGRGRRGGTIFTAGDLSKAEVIAIERCVNLACLLTGVKRYCMLPISCVSCLNM